MVWEATFEPRILHITSKTTFLRQLPNPRFRGCCRRPIPTHIRYKSREKAPIALQICHESRTLALKHYTPSFYSSTSPPERASEVKQTALYFSPELDTVHITGKERAIELTHLSYRTNEETIQSITVLAVEIQQVSRDSTPYIAARLSVFEGLETLIVVVNSNTGWDRKESIRLNVEGHLVEVKNRFVLLGRYKEWKLPEVKLMSRRDFENRACL